MPGVGWYYFPGYNLAPDGCPGVPRAYIVMHGRHCRWSSGTRIDTRIEEEREEASSGLHVRVDKIAWLHLGPLDAHASPEIVPIRFDGRR